ILILLLLFYQYRSSLEKNKLISAQKLQVEQLNDTKDELLSVLGHDLRSPMQHLITIFDRGFDTLERGERAPMLKLLQQGSVTTNKTYLLLDNVLQWVMQQQNDKSVTKHLVKLQPVIRELKETFYPIIETKQIQVSNHIEPDATVYADRGTLKIILRNLVDNALKFTPKKGKIAFHLVSSDGDMTAIQVQDNGRGMSIEKVKQLFHHSAPTKDTGGRRSTGLGLKLCQSFAKKNGGQLQVESKEGEGSTFTLWLPNSL
ncbi:MAG: HAMP domain-containing sensor histidine kinase, partial [Bacteroidota bacterium]